MTCNMIICSQYKPIYLLSKTTKTSKIFYQKLCRGVSIKPPTILYYSPPKIFSKPITLEEIKIPIFSHIESKELLNLNFQIHQKVCNHSLVSTKMCYS